MQGGHNIKCTIQSTKILKEITISFGVLPFIKIDPDCEVGSGNGSKSAYREDVPT